jgi:hypothetical protein
VVIVAHCTEIGSLRRFEQRRSTGDGAQGDDQPSADQGRV